MNRNRASPRRKRNNPSRISPEETQAIRNGPEYYDEETMGGSTPHPESDDDVLKSEQELGFYLDLETPETEEMDTQREINKGEKTRRRRRD